MDLPGIRPALDEEEQTYPPVIVNFQASINDRNIHPLIERISDWVMEGLQNMRLHISSSGGNPSTAAEFYNFLRSLPLHITTHNTGHVHSAAVPVFLAGDTRYAVENGHFLINGTTRSFPNSSIGFDTAGLKRLVALNENDDYQCASIIAARTNLTRRKVQKLLAGETIFQAQEAKTNGFIDEIRDAEIPKGSVILNVFNQKTDD